MSNLDHTMLQIYRLMCDAPEAHAILAEVLDLVIEATAAERGQIELYDTSGDLCFFKARKNGQDIGDRRASKISRKILAWVRNTQETVLSPDARRDARFRDSSSIWSHSILSVVCAPLRDENGMFGVLYLDHRKREALFDEAAKDLLEELAHRLAAPLRKAIAQQEERKRISRELQHARDRELGYLELIGNSPVMQKVLDDIAFANAHDENILILGESGTGKELVARLAHCKSRRNAKKFVPFDCSTVPENLLASALFGHAKGAFTDAKQQQPGVVEEAEGGTLFLDEIGNLSLNAQNMLLRFLEHKTYRTLGAGVEKRAEVRLMFGTNSDLGQMVQHKTFREDLFFRLQKGVTVVMPPLRERGKDILLLADFFMEKLNAHYRSGLRLGPEVCECLLRYSHPGNVRHLETILQEAARAALRAQEEIILPQHFPAEVLNGSASSRETLAFNLKFGASDFYAKYLPKEFQERGFIRGGPIIENENGNGAHGDHEPHEELLVSIKAALGLPLKIATRAVAYAFERNFLLALLRQTHGKQHEAIKRAHIHKSAFINKTKKYGINTRKNLFAQGEHE